MTVGRWIPRLEARRRRSVKGWGALAQPPAHDFSARFAGTCSVFCCRRRKGRRDEGLQQVGIVDDVTVIERILAGDVESFRTLVHKYEKALFRFVRNLVPDATECEDILQDVFLSAYANLHSYREMCVIEGIRMGTLKSRINRAKQKLRRILQHVTESPQ
jgi:hypothetical protein